ncbi:MAG: response regulator [Verrucomicrobia bacterium]|nr:MAG: response regulator [Verrucomicrobiota bacterium]
MDNRQKILLLDDDSDLLDLYREMLGQLTGKPEVQTSNNGARALSLLETEPFDLLICDLKMPKMDGLQVLSLVRRKHPTLRTVVLTSVMDEQFRSRVYALGADLFWIKPGSPEEISQFKDCIASLLGKGTTSGFRGMQNKSLVDIIQIECLTHSSSVLRISSGPLSGRIWINDGDLTDAETDGTRGEEALRAILAWKAGNFESLPAEPGRPRTIFKSYNALLLELAQHFDEAQVQPREPGADSASRSLAPLSQIDGVEFLLSSNSTDKSKLTSRGVERPERMAAWAHDCLDRFAKLGEKLEAGPLELVEGRGPQRNVALTTRGDTEHCVGWLASVSSEDLRARMKKIMALWVS